MIVTVQRYIAASIIILSLIFSIAGCGGGGSGGGSNGGVGGGGGSTGGGRTLAFIEMSPFNPTIAMGTSVQFTCLGVYSDNSTQDLTAICTYSSSDANVATIDTKGNATGFHPGTATIKCQDPTSGVIASVILTVTNATLSSFSITPVNPSIAMGMTQQMKAMGTFSDSSVQDMTNQVTWASSNPGVADISNLPASHGLITSHTPGTVTITATDPATNVSSATQLTVTTAKLVSIEVTPGNPSIALGTTSQFTATGIFSDSTTQNLTSQVSWSSSDSAVATISSASPTNGLATSVGAGVATITAADSSTGISGSTSLTVTTATLVSLQVNPVNPSLAEGLAMSFSATGLFSDNTTQDMSSQVVWTSSNPAAATIDPGTGLATALAAGVTTITATDFSGTISGSSTLNVTSVQLTSIEVNGPGPTLSAGLSGQYTAIGIFSDGSSVDITTLVTWASSDQGVASISNAPGSQGLATALSTGNTTITATDPGSGISGFSLLSVTDSVLQLLVIDQADPSLPAGLTEPLTVTGIFSDGTTQDMTDVVTWSSSDTTVATISNAAGSQGYVSSIAAGTTTIAATLPGAPQGVAPATTTLTVTDATISSLEIDEVDPTIGVNTSFQFTATGIYSDGSAWDVTTHVTWKSGDTSVAQISNLAGLNGLATAGSDAGNTTISATMPGAGVSPATTTLYVTSGNLQSLTISPLDPSIADGTSIQFTATGTYDSGLVQDFTEVVTWSSSDQSVATVSNIIGTHGLARGLSAGTTTITATYPGSGLSAQTNLTVTDAVLRSIAINPANPTMANGTGLQFAAIGTFSDSSTQDITRDVTWFSSKTSVVNVSNGTGNKGYATALSVGSATITARFPLSTITGSTTITVLNARLQSIKVIEAPPAAPPYSMIEGTKDHFYAIGVFSDGVSPAFDQDITGQCIWKSTNSNIAAASNGRKIRGLVTALEEGATNIQAKFRHMPPGVQPGSADLTVTSP